MYSNYNGNIEKNQMVTPPTIGLTTSIVNDKLNDLYDYKPVDTFTTTYTSKTCDFGNKTGGSEEYLLFNFLTEDVNNTKLCSLFYTTDPDKFYVYNIDVTFTIKSIVEDSSVDVIRMARRLNTLFINFNDNSSTLHFYGNNMYVINYTDNDNTIEGHLTFVAMGNFKPSRNAKIIMIYDSYSNLVPSGLTELTGLFDITLTIKRREL